jgi:hypothetical protein
MDYSLASHVSYGLVDSRAVLLDLVADRYLLLGQAETSVLAELGGGAATVTPAPLERLVGRGYVCKQRGAVIAPVEQPSPLASALETDAAGGAVPAFEAFRSSIGALLLMRVLGLAPAVARWRRIRMRHERRGSGLVEDLDQAAYIARGFAEARISVPMPRLCVPDSVALARSLWTRGLAADVYFGVQLDPLLAHAWVQRGPLILSDPLNIAADYTPVFKL